MTVKGSVRLVLDEGTREDELERILAESGYVVSAVTLPRGSGVEHVIGGADRPDLLVVDAYLRSTDAFDLARAVKEREDTQDLPVVFLAREGDTDTRLRGLEAGDDIVATPLDQREVDTRIERQVTVSKVRMALRESEAKFRSVMESAIDAIISADSDGVIRSWNSAAAVLFGQPESAMVGQPIEVIVPERFREAHRAGILRVTGGGPTHVIGQTVELAAVRGDGTEFPVELSLATWFLDEDRYYTGIIRDISERKQAEQKFRSVTDSAIDAIISADHVGEIVTWNSAATRILGYEEDEAVGQRLELIIPERFHEAHRNGMARFTSTEEPHVIGSTVELAARSKGGDEIPIELSLSTWTVREARYYTGIIRDIRERKAAEEALKASEQELREKSEELRRRNDELQETLDHLSQVQDQLILQEKMASLGKLSAGMAHELNNPAAAAQRGAAQALAVFTQLQDAGLRLGGSDLEPRHRRRITELDLMARETAQHPADVPPVQRGDLEAEFEQWLEEHGAATGGDLAPALVDLGLRPDQLAEVAAPFDGDAVARVVEWLGLKFLMYSLFAEVAVGTGRIVELVTALKTYTYLDQAPVQDVDLRDGLDNTLVILHNKLKRGVTVVREYDDDLPRIEAYASELNQVWTNLIDNAIDAMDGHGALVVRATTDGDGAVRVEIEDDGPGVPPEVLTRVFDPFFTTKPPGQGTGLGLAISLNIVVKKHHGTMDVDSVPGRTRFVVRLPLRLGAPLQPPVQPPAPTPPRETP